MELIGERILKNFFYNYLILNDVDGVEKILFENFKGIGTNQYELANSKEDMLESMKNQINKLEGKLSFYLTNYMEEYVGDIIISQCEVNMTYFEEKEEKVTTRLTTIFIKDKDEWKIMNMHNSIGQVTQSSDEILSRDWMLEMKNSKEAPIYLPDKNKRGFFKINEINYITYSSITRKATFFLNNLEEFEIRRNMSEIEEKLGKIQLFYKVDRGTIVNLENIKVLDFKEERIIFKNKESFFLSKNKLKGLEEKWFYLQSIEKIEI